jgi:hypothetical protein
MNNARKSVRVAAKAVFEIDNSRLGIGSFSRPLLDDEARRFKKAWESEALPDFEDFQVNTKRISFMTRPEDVTEAWREIDQLLARATVDVRKAS